MSDDEEDALQAAADETWADAVPADVDATGHRHLFRWSEVKAARAEGRPAVCHLCGQAPE